MTEQKLLKRKRKANLEGNKNSLANVCVDLAEYYFDKQNYETAIDEYVIASDVYKKQLGKELDYARTNRRIGEAFIYLKEYRKALDHQEIYLNIARQQGDKLEEQRALATIGHIHLTRYSDDTNKSSLNLAYKAFIKSFVICEELENVVNKYEHKDMMARLLGNLGVVLESLGDYDKGINFLLRSINICKSHDLYEQLQRSHTCLASLYCSKGDCNNAIQQYNAAMDVAGRLKNKVTLKYECLKSKADILIKLADFHGAKIVLLKAYKLIQSSVEDDLVEKLKVVAAMCYSEDSLLTTNDSDYKTKKSLYEKLGDGACFLHNYTSAIEYYKKMLEAAINNGESGLELSPCYISLAETYRDNKKFELAIKYYKKDCEITCGKESIKTLLNIADCMQTADKDILDIQSVYDQARNQCITSGDQKMQYRVVSQHIAMLRERGCLNEATQLENNLMNIDIDSSQSESEPINEEITTNIGDDVSIKDITDVSSDSDVENNDVNKPRTSRKRTKGFTIKKNAKGETQLHTACIAGNDELVRRLLEQGHTVNIRDNCGWLPIHEACICGHLEIVGMLIEKGAWINDKGGKLCDGITPLHDAASNGHLEVIRLLLNKGASAIAKTNSGLMPLHMLQKWRETNDIDSESSNLYTVITKRLTQAMDKLGHNQDPASVNEECSALVNESAVVESIKPTKKNKPVNGRHKSVIGKLRRNISCDKDLDQIRNISDDSEASNDATNTSFTISNNIIGEQGHAKDEYRNAIENLKHRTTENTVEKKRKSTESCRSALLEPEEIGDDWLEDDLPAKLKKRKPSTFTTFPTKHRSSSGSLRRHSSSTSLKSNQTDWEHIGELFESDFSSNEVHTSAVDYNGLSSTETTTKRKSQISLLDQGFTRQRSFSPKNLTCNTNKKIHQQGHQSKITNFGQSLSTSLVEPSYTSSSNVVLNTVFNPEPTLSIDVRIDGKLYRVPVLASELHFRTIRWLADEAADRYSRKECVRPTLELETKNGALLAEDDFLNVLFNIGTTSAEEVEAKIMKWNLPSLGERYIEACQNVGTDTNISLLKILQDTSTSLNLSGMGLGHKTIMPLCKAINRQINLSYLYLSDNFMRDSSFQLLCLSLPSLDNLTVLNLSTNELTSESLKYFAEIFVQSSKPLLTNLISLDLSYNSLGDESLKSLAILTRYLKLQILDLVDVGFTQQIFDSISNRNVDLCLDYITNINISYNKLNKQQITTILSWINPQLCEELNISNNNITEPGLLKDVTYWFKSKGAETLKLKTLSLSRCKVTDMEVDELLKLIPSFIHFKYLELRYNEYLTSNTLKNVLESPLIVDLVGCDNMLKNFEDFNMEQNSIRMKKLSLSHSHSEYIQKSRFIDVLKDVFHEKVTVVALKDYLQVSID